VARDRFVPAVSVAPVSFPLVGSVRLQPDSARSV
jgi:hypothetical protein